MKFPISYRTDILKFWQSAEGEQVGDGHLRFRSQLCHRPGLLIDFVISKCDVPGFFIGRARIVATMVDPDPQSPPACCISTAELLDCGLVSAEWMSEARREVEFVDMAGRHLNDDLVASAQV